MKLMKYAVASIMCLKLVSCTTNNSSHAGVWEGMHDLKLVTLKLHGSGKAEFRNPVQTLTGTWSQYDSRKSFLNIHGSGTLTTTSSSNGLLSYNKQQVRVQRISFEVPPPAAPRLQSKPQAVKPTPAPQTQSYHLNKLR
jgi:hypothetical protein